MFVKLIKYELYDLFKSKWVFGIFLFYLFLSYILLDFGKDLTKALISHNNISLITLPLFSLLLSSVYLYNNRNFIEFLLTQPVKRLSLFLSLFTSISLSLSVSYILGSLLPFYYLSGFYSVKHFLLTTFLVPFFVSLGLLLALLEEDRLKGVGFILLIWLFFSALYDSILLYLIVAFSDYPIDIPLILLTLANPIDLVRLNLLMDTGLHEVMGFVGKELVEYSSHLFSLSFLIPSLYSLILLSFGAMVFKKKDF